MRSHSSGTAHAADAAAAVCFFSPWFNAALHTPRLRPGAGRSPGRPFVVWRGDNESNDADDSEEDDDEGEYNVFGKELHKASDGVHKGDAKKVATETEVRLLML